MSSLKEDLSAFSREDLVYRAKLAEQAERCVLGARCDVRGAMRMRAMVVHAFARERERESAHPRVRAIGFDVVAGADDSTRGKNRRLTLARVLRDE
jgi:hypothetical protein